MTTTGASAAAGARSVILVTGGSGQVGFELVRELAVLAPVVAPSSGELDLGDADALRRVVRSLRPAAVVNAAAYTAVDAAETDAARAEAVNGVAPAVLADEAHRAAVPFVHYSTDYVFDGRATRPYTEADDPNPLGVYGRTKRDGERRVAEAGGAYLTFRTSWVYGLRGRNFLLTMLALARARPELRVVGDQFGAPTWSRMLAAATAQVVGRMLAAPEGAFAWGAARQGEYHLTAAGSTSWHGFAESILRLDPRRDEQVCRAVHAIPTAEYPTPARRPAYSVLDNGRFAETFALRLPAWDAQLALALAG